MEEGGWGTKKKKSPGVSAVMFVRMTEDDLQKRSARPTDKGLDAVKVCVCVSDHAVKYAMLHVVQGHTVAPLCVRPTDVQPQTDVLIQEPVAAYKHIRMHPNNDYNTQCRLYLPSECHNDLIMVSRK